MYIYPLTYVVVRILYICMFNTKKDLKSQPMPPGSICSKCAKNIIEIIVYHITFEMSKSTDSNTLQSLIRISK